MITIEQLSFRYPGQDRPCLEDVSLRLHAGEAVCVMGANGCGKSTLARIVAGLAQPSSGIVKLDIDGANNHALPVGILFQDPDNQMVAVVVDKEIAFALENLSTPEPELGHAVSEELRRFGIEPLARRMTTELSGGEKQRVALASIMVTNPHVIILDEPDSYLDEAGKRILDAELKRLHRERPELIELRITQYPPIALQYDRLVVMSHGRIVADGNPGKILSDRSALGKWGLLFSDDDPTHVAIPGGSHADRPEVELIELDKVSYHYANGVSVLREVSLQWQRGETIGVVGASGSGKSTLGHLLCGLLESSSGALHFRGTDHLELELNHRVGIVAGIFQQPERQFFLATCREEVAFGPKNFNIPFADVDVSAFLVAVGLDPSQFLERDPFALSMGEKRRLAFAAVLSMSPQFVVFDEPTCALDPEGVGRFTRLSRALKERRVGQMIISHDPDVIAQLADRICYLPGDGGARILSVQQWFAPGAHRDVMPLPQP